ncbi:MAG TPA: ABC transporter permease [Thermoanaerobaculia bacterium]|nr:ABC transporter permease [Thermoanaerobaculia bacterium]
MSQGSELRSLRRSLARSPGLAVAVWASTVVWFALAPALLSLLGALEWKALPFPDAGRVVEVQAGLDLVPELAATGLFHSVSSYDLGWFVASGPRGAVTVAGAAVDEGFFQALGSRPLAGRLFSPGSYGHASSETGAAVVTASLSRRLFGRSVPPASAVLHVGDRPFSVLGAVPDRPAFPPVAELWVLRLSGVHPEGTFLPSGLLRTGIVARLAEGTSVRAADLASRRVAREFEKREKLLQGDVQAETLETVLRRRSGGERGILAVSLAGLLAFVLLAITSALAGFLAERQGELTLRTALGARRRDLFRLVLLEILVLAVPGLLIGLPVALLVLKELAGFVPRSLAELIPPRLDLPSLALAAAAWAAAALLGSAGVWLSSPQTGLLSLLSPERAAARRSGPQAKARLGLVCLALGLAVALGACAAVLRQSLANREGVPLGFEPRHVETAVLRFAVPAEAKSFPGLLAQAGERLRRLPGVAAVAFSDSIPFASPAGSLEVSSLDRSEFWLGRTHRIGGEYLRVLGLRILAGRDFAPQELETGAPVALLDVTGAKEVFGAGSPLGRTILLNEQPVEIVGLVPTVRETSPEEPPRPQLYLPLRSPAPRGPAALALLLRLAEPLREGDLDAALAGTGASASQVQPLSELAGASEAPRRLARDLVTLQWVAALTLAALAAFGTFSWLLELRSFEFAVRLALGDSKAGIARRVLRTALAVTAVAAVLGLAIYLPAGQALRAFLFGVEVASPRALLSAVAAVVGVTLGAAALALRLTLRHLSLDLLKSRV